MMSSPFWQRRSNCHNSIFLLSNAQITIYILNIKLMASSALETPWVVTSERSSRGPMSSLKALWTQIGHQKIYSNYERPPFPIIIDKQSVYDLVGSWRFSDYCMFGAIYGTDILWAFTISDQCNQSCKNF
jgi:hypothetical protein